MSFEDRYAENWRKASYEAKKLTNFKCVLCASNCTETHHALYRDKRGMIAGREIPGVHIFPLCDRCHSVAHSSKNWRRDPVCPELGNRNTPDFYRKLRFGWLAKISGN